MIQTKKPKVRNLRFSANLVIGMVTITLIALFGILGPLFVNPKLALVGGVKANQKPSVQYILGTDSQGRDVFTTLVLAIPSTLKTGLIAGAVSVILGLSLGLMAGFFRGWADGLIRTMSDVLMAVPVVSFLILIVARMEKPNINIIAVVIALLTWSGTARGIRAQVLSIRERSYTQVARANGESDFQVLFGEIVPNLLPLMMACFIGAVTGGIYSVMALEVLGLGSKTIPTLGMMIFWSQRMSAVLRGLWWWWSPPILIIALIFIGLFLLSRGLDQFVNPTLTGVKPLKVTRRPTRFASRAISTVGATNAAGGDKGVLEVKNLTVVYETPAGQVKAVNDVTFALHSGERMGLIGESGSGKTTLATAIMRLLRPPASVLSGQIMLEGRDMIALSDDELCSMRLKEIALMPQAAMNSLNPVIRVGPQIRDAIQAHIGNISKKELDEMVSEALIKVGLKPEIANRYPHQLSGGMKQRVVMAIAIVLHPKVIIADEPTSALDVVVQKQVMLTLSRLQQKLGASVLLIGHDMGLITQFAEKIGVLYAGKLVETGSVLEVLDSPYHPYTRLLIDSLPNLDGKHNLAGITGLPPELLHLPSGCTFHPRCPFSSERCKTEDPELQALMDHRQVACHLYPEHTTLPPIPVKVTTLEA